LNIIYLSSQGCDLSEAKTALALDLVGVLVPGVTGLGVLYRVRHVQAQWDVAMQAEIATQKQAGHIEGTPQYANRLKFEKSTSSWSDAVDNESLTRQAWAKGKPYKGRQDVREYDFGYVVGYGPNGSPQTKVWVSMDGQGRIHGTPVGR
jgi:hypothetical protein